MAENCTNATGPESLLNERGGMLCSPARALLKHPSSCSAVCGAGQKAPSLVAVVKSIGLFELALTCVCVVEVVTL